MNVHTSADDAHSDYSRRSDPSFVFCATFEIVVSTSAHSQQRLNWRPITFFVLSGHCCKGPRSAGSPEESIPAAFGLSCSISPTFRGTWLPVSCAARFHEVGESC